MEPMHPVDDGVALPTPGDLVAGGWELERPPVNILVVDDEPANINVIEAVLADPDYRLVAAASPEAALMELLAADFALLILDVRLPGMTGFELAQMVRGRRRTAAVPIIFLTAYYLEDLHVLEGYDCGAVDYLPKPINAAILRSKVQVFVELYRRQRRADEVSRMLAAEVTSRRRAEDKLRELNDALEARVAARTASLSSSMRRLRAVCDGASEYMWLLRPDGVLIEVNRSALEGAGTEPSSAVGRPFAQTPWFVLTPGASDAVDAAVAAAAAGERPRLQMTIATVTGAARTIDMSLRPLYDDTGAFVLIFASALDVTARLAAEQAVRQSERRFRDIIDELPAAVFTVDAEGVLNHYNPACLAVSGRTPVLGDDRWCIALRLYRPDGTALSHDHSPMAIAMRTGRSRRGEEIILEHPDGRRVFVTSHPTILRDDDDRIVGGLDILVDITDRRRYEEHIRMLLDEVDHRSKNILSVVQAIARQTVIANPGTFVARFSERIQNLAVSHDLLVKNRWQAISIFDVLHTQVGHFNDLLGGRIMLAGPPFSLTVAATQTLGIILHELATNAAKYGALSVPAGRIEIGWQARHVAGRDLFTMTWVECGGPPVVAPATTGFGAVVMKDMAEASLDGEVALEFLPAGLRWHLACPAHKVLGDMTAGDRVAGDVTGGELVGGDGAGSAAD